MDVLHHGAATGVTGSCHELVLDSEYSVLIDCGLFQGAEASGTKSEINTISADPQTPSPLGRGLG